MNQPIISAIIATYKRNTKLERVINSVLNQTMDNIEIITVDDNDEKSNHRKLDKKLMEDYKDNEKVIYIKHH